MDKDTFLTKTFSDPKHLPPTGLGYFDMTYTPAEGRLSVEVRYSISFASATVTWTPELEEKFKKNFTARVPEYWNNKFMIRCTKEGWTDVVARPEFTLKEASDPHFDIRACGTLGVTNTAVRRYGIGHTEQETPTHGTAKFGSQAGKRWANAEFQLGKIKEHLKTPFTVPLGRETGPGQFSSFTMSLLQSYANNVNYAFRKKRFSKPTIRLTTVGAAITQPAERVKAILQGFGVKHTMKTAKGTGDGPATGVEVRWDSDKDFESAFPKSTKGVPLFSQATVVHEYGHMLGLPDEYNVLCSESEDPLVSYALIPAKEELAAHLANNPYTEAADTDAVRKTQQVFMELCGAAGLVPPPFGRANMNIMSGGSLYEAHHCVTVWNSLCGMTDGIIRFDEWKIRMAE